MGRRKVAENSALSSEMHERSAHLQQRLDGLAGEIGFARSFDQFGIYPTKRAGDLPGSFHVRTSPRNTRGLMQSEISQMANPSGRRGGTITALPGVLQRRWRRADACGRHGWPVIAD